MIAAAPIAAPAWMTVRRFTLAELAGSDACASVIPAPFPRVLGFDMLWILPSVLRFPI
jgi:hypothetical protein